VSTLVLDTNIVSYLMKGHSLAALYRPHLTGKLLAISFVTVAEMFEGAYLAGWNATRVEQLETVLLGYVTIPSSPEICRRWARVRTDRRSQPISSNDGWIAATALAHNCPLVTHNPDDFRDIPGLTVITELPRKA